MIETQVSDQILEEAIVEVNQQLSVEDLKREVSSRYVTLLQNILKHINDAGVGQEKHLRHYENNMNKFVNNSDMEKFSIILFIDIFI